MTPPSSHPQVASYGVKPKYGLVTYATDPKVLIRVSNPKSADADWVTEQLDKISYDGQTSGKGMEGGSLGVREVRRLGVSWEGVVRGCGGAGRTTF